MSYSNKFNFHLIPAVALARQEYSPGIPGSISATAIIRGIKKTVLGSRVPSTAVSADLADRLKSFMGTAIHKSFESALLTCLTDVEEREAITKALPALETALKRIVVNPDPDFVLNTGIPLYVEQRHYRQIMGMTVSGQFDFVFDGEVQDLKTTSTYAYIDERRTRDYILQGSIYRWLAPHIIVKPTITIHHFYTNWNAEAYLASPDKYPSSPILSTQYPLLTLEDTERYLIERLSLLQELRDKPEEQMPPCTDADLWRKPSVWKYYADPSKLARSTKNFDNQQEAEMFYRAKGKGVVIEKKGTPSACKYCPAFTICKQKDQYIQDGSLLF